MAESRSQSDTNRGSKPEDNRNQTVDNQYIKVYTDSSSVSYTLPQAYLNTQQLPNSPWNSSWSSAELETTESETASLDSSASDRPLPQGGMALRLKTFLIAIALSSLPVMAMGATAYYFTTQAIARQEAEARQSGVSNLAEVSYLGFLLQRQIQSGLIVGTGVVSLLAAAVAMVWAERSVRSTLRTAAVIANAAQRLRQQSAFEPQASRSGDLLTAMQADLSVVTRQAAELQQRQATEQVEMQLLKSVTDRTQHISTVEDFWVTTVAETRRVLNADRVIFFQLGPTGDGIVMAESVADAFPKILGSHIVDPCFKERHIDEYRQGRVRAISNIHQAGMTECHVDLLKRYAVKANLVAPVLREGELLGLLIAHQCSRPRAWQPAEVRFFARLAIQVGQAVAHVSLLSERRAEATTKQLLDEITYRIREVRSPEDTLEATTAEIRRVLKSDRVIFFQLEPNGDGTVAAESVADGFPAIRGAKIIDPCFKERHLEMYRQGRVRAIDNIHQANMTTCHVELLSRYAVKANLVAPVVCEGNLIGLLIAHQCSRPRVWKSDEIQFFANLSTQVGFAVSQVKLAAERQIETEGERLLDQITRRIRDARSLEETLENTVQEARALIQSDRVIFFRLEINGEGFVAAESVADGFLRTQGSRIFDPCFKERHIELYQQGRVRAIDNIHRENLTGCHVELLEQYGVKANLIAPVICDGELMGLLIAHQCSRPRTWKPAEIHFFSRLATQVGYALDRRRFPAEAEAEARMEQVLNQMTKQIRELPNPEAVFDRVVHEARQVMETDRVLFFKLKPDGSSGCATAESVAAELPKTLGIEIADPCFKDRHVNLYRQGRVRVMDNIYSANLSECHIDLLRQFGVQSDLIAPVVQGGQLLGLLIAHHCSKPRAWQPIEINFFSRLAAQVGYALDQISLTQQIEQVRHQLEGTLQPRDRAIAAANMGITMSDARQPDYPLIYCNPAFEEMTGYSQEEALGRNCRFLQGPDTDVNALNEIRTALREQRECRVLLKNYRKDGTAFWNELRLAPVRDEQGQVTHFIGLQVDVSAAQQTTHQIQSATQMINEATQVNQTAIALLIDDVSTQTEQVGEAWNKTQLLTAALQELAIEAQKTKSQIQYIQQLIEMNNSGMNQVEAALNLKQILEMAEQINQLGAFPEKMTGIISPINDLAVQTSVLAMNLAVEVGRSENQNNRELMTVAESVRSLAQQSEAATVEVQQVVSDMRAVIEQAVTVMQTEKVNLTVGAEWIEQIRQRFGELVMLTAEQHQLVEVIAEVAETQARAAETCGHILQDTRITANRTTTQSEMISAALADLLTAAEMLQTNAESV